MQDMLALKSENEIKILAEGGARLARILDELSTKAVAGVTGVELDMLARELITSGGDTPAFLGYGSRGHEPFPAALCVSVNQGLVHGVPGNTSFASGDVVKLDLGLIHDGMYLDSARTVVIGTPSAEVAHLLDVTRQSLVLGIEQAVIGNTIGDIGFAVQTYVEGEGLEVVRSLVGHGVGYAVHEEPSVPNFGKAGQGPKIELGLVIAIEPMVTIGDPTVITSSDGWTVETQTGNLCAHEEHTIAVTADGPVVLTK